MPPERSLRSLPHANVKKEEEAGKYRLWDWMARLAMHARGVIT